MNELPREVIGEFIDAVVRDRARADGMLAADPRLLNARWIADETVLHFLAVEGYADGVQFLASRGADVNAVDTSGDTALVSVAILGWDPIADILLCYGADPNARSVVWENPLHAAAHFGRVRLVDLLLKAGADGQYRTDLDETVFDAVRQSPADDQPALLAILAAHGLREPDASDRETE